eukprot:COSAG01_NODE_828_length_13273_cov_231.615484_4_plen_50_part_00
MLLAFIARMHSVAGLSWLAIAQAAILDDHMGGIDDPLDALAALEAELLA